ncbi:MAG: ATP-binding protein [Bacteroidota bacterium]|nr:ATP-binding protein [Bacteroidota bacterium]
MAKKPNQTQAAFVSGDLVLRKDESFIEKFKFLGAVYDEMGFGAITIDKGFRVSGWNTFALELFGRDSFSGEPEFVELFPGKSAGQIEELLEHCLQQGESMNTGLFVNLKKRDGFFIELSIIPVFNAAQKVEHMLGILKDVSNYAEENLRYSKNQELLFQMLRNIPNAMIFLIAPNQQVIVAEGAEMRRLNLQRDNISSKHISAVLSDNVYKTLQPLIRLSLNGTSISHEMIIRENFYYIQAVPIKEQDTGGVMACMLIFENITEDKLNAEALKSAKRKAERSNEAKSKFLANVSHEIRTPLNTVIGFAEQMQKTKLDSRQSIFLEAIMDSSSHLLSIVNETITLSQIETGEVSIDPRAFYVKDVFREIESIERFKAAKKGVELSHLISQRLDTPIKGDPVRLKQILLNLVNNAIKFTDEGSVTYTAEIEDEQPDEMRVKFRVIDTGIGIHPENIKLIFREFTQADDGITKRFGGSGLGLTIAKKLVNMLHGNIQVESIPEKGSEFSVSLPFKKIPGSELPILRDSSTIDPSVLKNKSILLVDDDELNRLLAKTIFDEWNIEYALAEDGFRALDIFEKKKFDIILMDIHMPGMSGMEVTQRIRKLQKMNKNELYILAVTANVIEKDLKKFMEAGMDGYLLKPFKEGELFDTIVRFIYDESVTQEYIEKHRTVEPSEDAGPKETNQDAYNLDDLRGTTGGNESFFNTMINTFVSNTESNLKMMQHFLHKEDWKNIGEMAHKMIPSCRHLKMYQLVIQLEKIEDLSLRKKKYGTIPEKVKEFSDTSSKVIEELKNEIK